MTFEFQSTLFNTRLDLAAEVAFAWMTANGSNSPAEVTRMNGSATPEKIAATEWTECKDAWDLTDEWLDARDLTEAEMLEAFAEFVRERPDIIPLQIDFQTTEHDDGYNIADWFQGGWNTIEEARHASSKEAADKILTSAYVGPDVDGVEVTWTIGE